MELRSRGVTVMAEGDKLLVKTRRGALSSELKAMLRTHKAELLAELRTQAGGPPRVATRPCPSQGESVSGRRCTRCGGMLWRFQMASSLWSVDHWECVGCGRWSYREKP